VSRALLLLALLLTVGEVTGVLDLVLDVDCGATSAAGGEDGCTLCPCCNQGQILAPETTARPAEPGPIACLDVGTPRADVPPVSARIFHPPRLAAR